jgi:hypothetical protein
LVSLIFNWSPLENNFTDQDPIWEVYPNTKNWLDVECLFFASLAIIWFFD